MQNLEEKYSQNQLQHSQFKQHVKQETRKMEEKEKQELRGSMVVGGYTITTTNSEHDRSAMSKRHGTFNAGNLSPLHYHYDRNAAAITDMMKIMQKCLTMVKTNAEKIEGQTNSLECLENEFDGVQRQQKVILENQTYQMDCINDNTMDFEDHKKLIQQLVRENNELQNEVTMLKRIEIPAIKQCIMKRSGVSERPSAPPSQPNQPNLLTPKGLTQIRIEPSLRSCDFGFNEHEDRESDCGIMYKNSELNDLEGIHDAESINEESENQLKRVDPDIEIQSMGKLYKQMLNLFVFNIDSWRSETLPEANEENRKLGNTYETKLSQSVSL